MPSVSKILCGRELDVDELGHTKLFAQPSYNAQVIEALCRELQGSHWVSQKRAPPLLPHSGKYKAISRIWKDRQPPDPNPSSSPTHPTHTTQAAWIHTHSCPKNPQALQCGAT